jgi:hypothetical protein
MSSRDDEARKANAEKLRKRIEHVRQVLNVYDVGGLSEGTALSQIEEIASGDADPIVHIGKPHTPEITT